MRRTLILAVLLVGACFAEEKEYHGAAGGGVWNDDENWAPFGVPDENDVAVFNSETLVEIGRTESMRVGGLVFNADVTIVSGAPFSHADRQEMSVPKIIFPDGTATVFVAEGVTAKVGADVMALHSDRTTLVKTGKGTLLFTGYPGAGGRFDVIDIAEGEVLTDFGNNNDGLQALLIRIRDGALLRPAGYNQYYNYVRISIDEGGVYDAQSQSDTVGGIVGSGLATNMANQTFTLGGDSDYVFTGVCNSGGGSINIGCDNLSSTATQRFVIATADCSAMARYIVHPLWWDKLTFAPGVGTYRVKRICGNQGSGLVLQDAEGGPVRVDTEPSSNDRLQGTISGPGTLGISKILYVTNGAPEFALSGGLGAVSGMTTIFGGNMEGETYSFGNVSWLFADDANLRFNFGEDMTVDIPVAVTNGQVQQWGNGDLALSSVALSNVLVRTEKSAGALTIHSGSGKDVNIQNNSTNGALTVEGCTLDGVEVYSGTWNAAPLVFRDSEAKNMKLSFNSGTTFRHKFVFDGGRYEVTNNNFGVYSSNSVVVTGGELTFFRGESAQYNRFMMPWTFTGGRSIFYHPMSWNQGFGADISGEGTYVRLMNTNLFETTSRNYRVASDGYSHVVRVRDGGHLVSDGFVMNSAGTTVVSTGAVEVLEGGTWTLCTGLTGMGGENDALKWSYLFFNGGVFESGGSYDYASSGILLSTAAHHFTWVGEKGFTLRHAPASLSCGYSQTINPAFEPAPWVESDGGMIRTGHGSLLMYGPIKLHGPYDHRDGKMTHYAASLEAPMGYGDVILGGVMEVFNDNKAYAAATDPGATVTLNGAAEIVLARSSASAGSSLTLGAPDAAANSVLVRGLPGSAIVIHDGLNSNNTSPFGDGPCAVKVNGGVATSATTGLSVIPALGLYYNSRTGDRRSMAPLAYDSVKGFVMPAFADDDFTGGSSSHVRVLTPTALTSSVAVGSLSVFGCNSAPLTLADGVTVTIGDGVNPAPLILNSSSSHSKVASVTGGRIDFGGSEGVVASGQTKGNADPVVIASVIDGRNGLSICCSQDLPIMVNISGVNVYSGDTRVNNAVVYVRNAQAFSSGTVHALGAGSWGGALHFDQALTVANAMHVSGYGPYNVFDPTTQSPRGQGALRFAANTTLTGALTLGDGVTRFNSSVIATFTGAMSGPGAERLELAGVGTFVFNGTSSCTNAVTVCDGTTLRLRAVDAAGTGPMRVDGRVVFANAAAGVCPNVISGGGEITVSGAPVRFADLSRFTGTLKMADGTVIDLMGADVELSALIGGGVVTNSGAAATLTVATAESDDVDFAGSIVGDISFVKTGGGVQHLSGRTAYTGATVVEGGALVLRGRDVPDALPVADAVLRLDATALSGLADGDVVSEWTDADGRGWTFSNSPDDVCPKYAADALNGHPALWFGDLTQTRLCCTASFQTRTIFAAYRTASGTHAWSCAGFFGYANNDRGLRFASSSEWQTGGWNGKAISFAINGVNGVRTFTNNYTAVVSAEYDSNHAASTYAVGDYWADTRYNRFYYGWIGELIVYDRVLTDDEKSQVNAYLMKKWGVREYETPPALTNALPETTALTVSGAGVLDLAGGSHTVASIAGDGIVTNSAAESAELRLTGEASSAFTGRILGDVALTLVGGASIDLGGGSASVSAVAGDGRVANGTLAVGEIRPGGMGAAGTLVFERAPAPGATYMFEGFGPIADKVVIEGDFDLSTMAFTLVPSALAGLGYEVLTVGGTRTGEDFSALFGRFRAWSIFHYDDGSTWLKNKVGTAIIIK